MAIAKPIAGLQFIQALLDAGIITPEENATRVIIEARADGFVKLCVERAGDERLIRVALKAALDITDKEPGQ